MHKIYKYPLNKSDLNSVVVPLKSTVLRVDLQEGKWVVWVMVNPDISAVDVKKIRVIGTGHEIEDISKLHYLNTFFESSLVWHAFEER